MDKMIDSKVKTLNQVVAEFYKDGEDEVANLDSETIYFIIYLLNKLDLKKFRNEILATALPLRI